MNKSIKIILGIAVLAIIIASIIYITYKPKGTDLASPPSVSKKVRIIDGTSINSIHVLLAYEKGYFADEGLEAEVSYAPIGKLCMDALNAGGADYAGVVEMNVAHNLFRHKDMAILTEYSEPITAIKVLGRKDHGVNSAKDLIGKKIGVFFGVNIHVFTQKLLAEQGISLDEVELSILKPPEAAAAFISGEIDAVTTWEPIVTNIRNKVGENTVLITQDAQKYWPWKCILVTKQSYLKSHGEEAKKVLRAIIKADKFFKEHPDQAYDIVSKRRNLPREIVPDLCNEISYVIQLTPRLQEMIEYEVEWLPKYLPTFFKDKKPTTTDYRSLIATELKDITPESYKLQ